MKTFAGFCGLILWTGVCFAQESASEMYNRISGAAASRHATKPGKDLVVTNAVKQDEAISESFDPRNKGPWHLGDTCSMNNQSLGVVKVTSVSPDHVVVNYCGRQLTLIGVKTTGLFEDEILTPSCAFKIVKVDHYAGEDYYTLQPVESRQREIAAAKAAAARKAVEASRAVANAKREKDEAAKWRTWTDSTGQHTIEAKFSGIIAGKVQLTQHDGTRIQLALEKLSEEDQEWIKSRKK